MCGDREGCLFCPPSPEVGRRQGMAAVVASKAVASKGLTVFQKACVAAASVGGVGAAVFGYAVQRHVDDADFRVWLKQTSPLAATQVDEFMADYMPQTVRRACGHATPPRVRAARVHAPPLPRIASIHRGANDAAAPERRVDLLQLCRSRWPQYASRRRWASRSPVRWPSPCGRTAVRRSLVPRVLARR